MVVSRAARRVSLVALRALNSTRIRCIATAPSSQLLHPTKLKSEHHPSFNSRRLFSVEIEEMSGDTKLLDYEQLLEAQKDEDCLIIDVREQNEINETGKLPGSIHIPMGYVVDALTNLSDGEFEQKYGREKPDRDTKIILSCKSGKRSGMVQDVLLKIGFENSYNYYGGWSEWEKNQK